MDTTKPKVSPKDFFLHLAVIVTLYVSTISLLNLLFQVINIAFPDRLEFYYDPYSSSIRWAIASLIIVFPLFIFLTWLLKKDYTRFPEKENLWIRKWLVYLTLFIAGITIGTTLIVLINTFLGGEITVRFILKILSVLVVTGGIFSYFIYDLKTDKGGSAKVSKIYTYGSCALVLLSIIVGFFVMGSPFTQRLIRFDQQRISDLQSIQWQIIYVWQQKGTLPKTLSELNDPISGFSLPLDPESETGKSYSYAVLSNTSFKLCADFSLEDTTDDIGGKSRPMYAPIPEGGTSMKDEAWNHPQGSHCFERTIDPEIYPVRKK